ncbi:MAG: choice-of-anchor D domain-containing protein [Bacteroidota bacterium]
MLKRLLFSLLLLCTVSGVFASHFRYGLVTATRLSETSTQVTYRLNVSLAWRLGAAPVSVPFAISGGNSGSVTVNLTNVTDPSGGWTNSSGTANVTLNKSATLTRIEFTSSAKISTIINNHDLSWDVYTIINTNAPGSSPVTTLPAIINMPINAIAATYTIPASDPDPGSTLTYGLPNLTSGPLNGQTEPSGFSVNSTTGQITLNTTNKTVGQQYNALVTVTDNDGNQIMLDFIINMVGFSNPPVFDYSVTPTNGFVYNVIAGQNISFPINATDPDAGSTVSFSVSGLPSYITTSNFSPALPATGNPSQTTFSWTPATAQIGTTNILNIIATDNVGVQSTTSVTLKVVAEPAPAFISPTPGESTLRQIVTGVLQQDNIVAQSSLGSNVTIAFATVPTGAVLSPAVPTSGANPGQTTMSWTPTPADFGQHSFSYQAVISSTPTIFVTRNYSIIVNTPPAFSSTPTGLNVNVGDPFSYNVTVTDPDIPYGDVIDIVGSGLPSWLTLTSTGNGTAVLSGTPTAANGGINHIDLEAEDTYHHGNPAAVEQAFDINVIVCTAPTIVCPANVTVVAAPGSCQAAVTFALPTVTGTSPTITYSIPSGSNFTTGITPVTVVASNSCGTVGCTFNVTVLDQEKPVITCPSNQTLNLDASCNATLPDYRSLVTATDNCTPSNALTITQSPAAGTSVNAKGAMIITFTVTDASNNSSTCTISVDKKDVTAPVINCPASIAVNNTANVCGAVVSFAIPTATDNCSGSAFNFFNSGEPNNAGNEDYIQLYTNGTWNDLNGNNGLTSIVEFNSIITTTFTNYNRLGTFGGHTYYQSTLSQSWPNARTSAIAIGGDLASINTLGESQFLAPYGGNTWVGGYQDHSDPSYVEPGNASQNFGGWKWVDGTKLGAGQITITQIAGLASGSVFPVGVTTNTFRATDESGNASTCSFTVTVKDITAPVLAGVPANTTAECSAVPVMANVTGSDNCSAIGSVNAEQFPSSTLSALLVHNYTYNSSAADSKGSANGTNVNGVSFAPGIIGNAAQFNGSNYLDYGTGASINGAVPFAISVWIKTASAGQQTIIQQRDGNVNGQYILNIGANHAGTISVPGRVYFMVYNGTFQFEIYSSNRVDDNKWHHIVAEREGTNGRIFIDGVLAGSATGPLLALSSSIGTYVGRDVRDGSKNFVGQMDELKIFAGNGTTCTSTYDLERTWSVTDAAGNMTAAQQIISLHDTQAPVLSAAPADATVECNAVPAAAVLTATDNCSTAVVTYAEVRTNGSSVSNYTLTRTWTATDACGNTSTKTQVITVQDTQLPLITAPADITVNNTAGQCVATSVNLGTPVTSDNCGVKLVTNNAPATYPIGNTTVTWTVTDNSNNIATATQVITVVAPEINITGNSVSIAKGDVTPSVADNTDFGSTTPGTVVTKTFTIQNTGTADLTVSSINISGANAADFTTSGISLPATIAANSSASFTVSFASNTVNTENATVTVNTNDCDEASYDFAVKALVFCTTPVFANTNGYLQQPTNTGSCDATVTYPLSVSGVPAPSVTYVFTGATTGTGTGTGSGQVFNTGITHVVVTASNACATVTNLFDVTVVDNVKPIAVTKNITVYLDATGHATISPADIDNGSHDNCGTVSLSLQNSGIICATAAENSNLTLTAPAGTLITGINFASYGTPTGSCGAFALGGCNSSVSLSKVQTAFLNKNSATIGATNAVFGDPCNGTVKRLYVQATYSGGTTPINSFDCSKLGDNTVTLIVTDANGNTSSTTAIVTVKDNIAPTPTVANLPTITAQCSATVTRPTATDICAGTITATTTDPLTYSTQGTFTINWSYSDGHGNVTTQTQTVIVKDVTAPVLNGVPANVTVECNAVPARANVTASDNCSTSVPTFTETRTDGACANTYTLTRTWSTTDAANNTTTATQVITVRDTKAPVLSAAPANTTVSCDAIPAAATLTAADNCDASPAVSFAEVSTQDADVNSGAHYNYTLTRSWTATDACGNASVKTQVITVRDVTAPGITIPANTVLNSQDNNSPAATGLATGTDVCSPVTITYSDASTQVASSTDAGHYNYTITRTWTATDVTGNASSGVQVITVHDVTAPVITVPANTVLNCQDDNSTVANGVATGTDDVSPATITYSDVNAQVASVTDAGHYNYTITRTWTATDVSGNATSGVQVITVHDVTAPVITVPANKVLNCQDNNGTVANGVATGSDNCGPVTITYSDVNSQVASVTDAGHYNYTITRTWTATDVTGNATSGVQVITVHDVTNPLITVPSNVTLNCQDDNSTAATGVATGTDNCGPVTITYSDASTQDANTNAAAHYNYTISRTWTATDVTGNHLSSVQTIKVQDITAPVIVTCPASVTQCNDQLGNNKSFNFVATDNCSPLTTTYSINGPGGIVTGSGTSITQSFAIGTTTIVWTVKDASGNTSTGTTTVVINPLPVVTYVSTDADAFCSKVTLTASSNITPASYSWTSAANPVGFNSSALFSLGLANNDGAYNVWAKVDATGCISPVKATYNFQKQNLASSYTILASKEVELGKYNKVVAGSVGVTTAKGDAEFNSYSLVNGVGSVVKAPKIDIDGYGAVITTQVIGIAAVTLPTMQYNTASTKGLANYTVQQNGTATLTANYNNLTVKKGGSVTVTGSTFGTINLEAGASIKFTNPALNIDKLSVDDGAKDNYYSYVSFAPNTSVRISSSVSIGSQVRLNQEAYKVTFYMADQKPDEEKFTVKGGDTRVIANIYMPNGKLRVTATDSDKDDHDTCDHKAHTASNCKHKGHGHKDCDHRAHDASVCNDDVYMTGLFIAEEVESKGNTVIWSNYDCSAPPVTTITSTTAATSTKATEATATATSEEELKVTVMPNPSTTIFTLKLESKSATPVNMKVMDLNGRVIEAKSGIGSNSTIQIGQSYMNGTYYAEMIQGTKRKVVQLIKLK